MFGGPNMDQPNLIIQTFFVRFGPGPNWTIQTLFVRIRQISNRTKIEQIVKVFEIGKLVLDKPLEMLYTIYS